MSTIIKLMGKVRKKMPPYKNPQLRQVVEGDIMEVIGWSDFTSAYLPKAVDREHRALLIFQFLVGGRPAEVQRISRDRVTVERNRIYVRVPKVKGGRERLIAIPIMNDETQELKQWILNKLPKQYLFPSLAIKKNPRDYFITLNKNAGIGYIADNGEFYPASFYVFRHNIETLLSLHGAGFVDIVLYQGKKLERMVGSAGTYVHTNQQWADKMAKILRAIMRKS